MRFCLCFLLLLTPDSLHAWESYKTDITQQTVPQVSDGLDHLEPVDRKIPESNYLVEFIREPAVGDQNTHLTLTSDAQTGRFYVRTWSEWKKENQAHPLNEALSPSVKVELPVDVASCVYAMWLNELFEVRYDRQSHSGLDGWNDLFSASIHGRGWLHGSTWSPMKDLPPKWMEDSATALIQFTKDKDEAICRRTLTDLRDKLFAYLAANGKN